MKFSIVAFSAALVAFVSAQTQGQLPQCATGCVTQLLPASCNGNPECICKDNNFISNISCCIFNACPASDQTAALNFAKTYCTPVGVTLPAQAGCSGNSTSSAAASSSASASASSRASSASSSAVSSASSSASAASSAASSAAASATSRAAGEKLAAQGISLVGAVIGAVALL